MRWLKAFAGYLAPIFLVLSPVFSYSDQALSMHRSKSSAGFSLDIPLIMLVASLLKIFYWPHARFDSNLLVQAFLMIFMQVILLKIALDHRPPPSSKGGDAALPFAGGAQDSVWGMQRPYNFWQWRSPKPYWQFLLYLFIILTMLELILAPMRPLYALYATSIGYLGLTIEATLPLPQIFTNARSRSCKGFRLSVIITWLLGDAMKMFWFFTSTTEIPWAFKLCGIFQAGCDIFLGLQYLMYGDGETRALKDRPMTQYYAGSSSFKPASLARVNSGRTTPTGRRTPLGEKDLR